MFQSKSKALSTHCLGMSYYVNFLGDLGSNEFHIKWRFGTHGSWKNQNPGGLFGAKVWYIKNLTMSLWCL